MAVINENYRRLSAGYLFPEIGRRVSAFQEANPQLKVHRLGIGNTTEPLTPAVVEGLREGVERLAHADTYTGYGDEQGEHELRAALARLYARRGVELDIDEIFVSDGAKPDSANIQSIFGPGSVVAVQDPAYPVYVDTNVIAGRTGAYDPVSGRYRGLVYMPCTRDNGFVPTPPAHKTDLVYLCSPNNPTGAVATHRRLQDFVDYARGCGAVIIFDASYCEFITDPGLPKSIFEVKGAEQCAIEVNSFSKSAGFTGVRLGWSVVPKKLVIEGSEPGEVHRIWYRRQTTFFNGASNIAQRGGLAALSDRGFEECAGLVGYYMQNARLIGEGLKEMGLAAFGGTNAPYIWLETPGGLSSWDFFDKLLQETQVVGTPGSGFGPSGEGYFRLSAFGHRADIVEAVGSIREKLVL